jgi:hypothetical protein
MAPRENSTNNTSPNPGGTTGDTINPPTMTKKDAVDVLQENPLQHQGDRSPGNPNLRASVKT